MPRSIVSHFPILRNEETRRLDRPPSGGAVPASDSACSTELSAEGEGRMRGRGMRLGTTGDPAGSSGRGGCVVPDRAIGSGLPVFFLSPPQSSCWCFGYLHVLTAYLSFHPLQMGSSNTGGQR